MARGVFTIGFQHPDSGFPCRATFVGGQLSIAVYATDPDLDRPQGMSRDEFVAAVGDAEASAKKVSGRYRNIDAATDALERFGVDVYDEGDWRQDGL